MKKRGIGGASKNAAAHTCGREAFPLVDCGRLFFNPLLFALLPPMALLLLLPSLGIYSLLVLPLLYRLRQVDPRSPSAMITVPLPLSVSSLKRTVSRHPPSLHTLPHLSLPPATCARSTSHHTP
jgi:hypothetical protein